MNKLTKFLPPLVLLVAVAAALTAVGAGLGFRFGWWPLRAGIDAIRIVFWVALGCGVAAVLVVALLAFTTRARRGLAMCATGLAVAAVTAWIPFDLRATASALPPIHDISTDLADPPQFVRVAALRKTGDHPVAYDGDKVAAQQQKAYPDIVPVLMKAPPDKVFAAAQAALGAMGLELDDADAGQGRLEATETSLLFGFKDDVVVRIAATAEGSKIDVRSKSRIGGHDIGMNAKRVRTFVAKLKSQLG